MSSNYPAPVSCPHCGHVTCVRVTVLSAYQPQIILCSTDDGGCGTYYAVTGEVKITMTAHRIEGLGPDAGTEV